MFRLANPVQRYAWGSPTAIPELLGTEPDGGPVAEVWMGAHALAPSCLLDGGAPEPLDAAVVTRPHVLLGHEVVERWGTRLPFLLKVIAAAEPLSLQVHPSAEQAAEGFTREEAAGLARDAPQRSYRDPWHKPELVLALTPFRALCGLREPAATLAVLDDLHLPGRLLEELRAALRADDAAVALAGAFDLVVTAGAQERAEACAALAAASAARLATGASPHPEDDACVAELQRAHPGDVGVLLSVLAHHTTLAPGECLYLGAGQVHAYRSGVAVEVMASSDNVLRAGLTTKHVDLAELRSALDLTPAPLPRLVPTRTAEGVATFQPPVEDFGLDVVDVPLGALPEEPGPRIVLALAGEPVLHGHRGRLVLRRGESVFVPAGEAVRATGDGRLAVARIGRR